MPGGMLLRGLVLVSAARAAATVQVTVPGEANGKTADLRCAGFGAIAVNSARYGDPPGCATPRDALEEVTTMCGGRTSCAYPVCCCTHLGPAFAGFNVGVRHRDHHPTHHHPQSSPALAQAAAQVCAPAGTPGLGDPCSGTKKDFTVEYGCTLGGNFVAVFVFCAAACAPPNPRPRQFPAPA